MNIFSSWVVKESAFPITGTKFTSHQKRVIIRRVKAGHLVVDFLHELDVKRFEPVPGWGDEEEAGMDEGVGQVTSLDLS